MILDDENIAIIDFGTNTFHLIIYHVVHGNINKVLYQKSLPVKLKEGGWKDGYISPEAILRADLAMQAHFNTMNDYDIHHCKAIGTEALRIAKNSNELIQLFRDKYNVEVDIISGDQEATYIYYGVMKYHHINGNVLIMDIGGGSVEFIIADKDQIFWKRSIPIGASKLKNKFHLGDKITKEEQMEMVKYLKAQMEEVFQQVKYYAIDTLVGTSGSFETIYDVINHKKGLKYNDPWILYPIAINDYNMLHYKFINSTFQERLEMGGMTQFRADMMVVSSILIQTLISTLRINNILLARTAIKEGVAYELLHLDSSDIRS